MRPLPNAVHLWPTPGAIKVLDCTTSTVSLDGTASSQGLQYNWTAIK